MERTVGADSQPFLPLAEGPLTSGRGALTLEAKLWIQWYDMETDHSEMLLKVVPTLPGTRAGDQREPPEPGRGNHIHAVY